MPSTTRTILAAASLLLGVHAAAQAGPILLVTNGILMGAQGIELGGLQYDVAFSDTRPQAANFLFDTYGESYDATAALRQQVFQGVYDTSPGKTNGCTNLLSCAIVTGYHINWLGGVDGAALTNTPTRYIDPITPYTVLGNLAATLSTVTYAHWSVHEVRQAVPEPSTLLLTGLGLAALALRRKRAGAAAG